MAKEAPKTIELLQKHEHGGREYPPGATLTLPAEKADWLVGIKVAKLAAPAAK